MGNTTREIKKEEKEEKTKIDNNNDVLFKFIDECKKNKNDKYRITIKIEGFDKAIYPKNKDDEKEILNNINISFNKAYSFSSDIIFISNYKFFDDSYFTKLMRIKWENLNELILPHNNITKINPLTNYPLINLERIDLSYNLLEDIDDLEEVNMVKLNSVNFRNNKIDSPSTFINKIFYKLQYLNLLENNIDEMDKESFAKKYKKKNPNVELLI